jgi:holo-[acyl-carrier protein] synthase
VILGLGIDVIEVKRVEASLARFADRFEKRVFTAAEREYCRARKTKAAESFALRWAAKEAVAKAMGTGIRGGVDFADIEVAADRLGRPSIRLHGGAAAAAKKRGIEIFHVSLTHEGDLAVAFAVAEGGAKTAAPKRRTRKAAR